MRCDFNMTKCEPFHTFIIRDICKIFEQKNQMWTEVVAHTKPRVKCPFKAVPVKVTNATVDFSYITHLPLGGYTWIITFKVFKSIPHIRHKKQMIFCILSESSAIESIKSSRESTRSSKTGRK